MTDDPQPQSPHSPDIVCIRADEYAEIMQDRRKFAKFRAEAVLPNHIRIDTAHQRLLRRLHRHRVKDVCAVAGLHKNSIINLRSGKSNPSLKVLLKIEQALDALEAE